MVYVIKAGKHTQTFCSLLTLYSWIFVHRYILGKFNHFMLYLFTVREAVHIFVQIQYKCQFTTGSAAMIMDNLQNKILNISLRAKPNDWFKKNNFEKSK